MAKCLNCKCGINREAREDIGKIYCDDCIPGNKKNDKELSKKEKKEQRSLRDQLKKFKN